MHYRDKYPANVASVGLFSRPCFAILVQVTLRLDGVKIRVLSSKRQTKKNENSRTLGAGLIPSCSNQSLSRIR